MHPHRLAILAALLSAACVSNPRLERLSPAPAPEGGHVAADVPWVRHELDNPNYRLPNGLEAADADGDGRQDYLTNYEWTGRVRIAFHPGRQAVRSPWPAADIALVSNAESSTFGDLDGDGDPDVVVVHGEETLAASGVTVVYNPGGSAARDPVAWGKAREIPIARGLGHLHFVRCRDLDRDGAVEIIVGGRGAKDRKPGLRILRRAAWDVWEMNTVDGGLESGHGFVFADLDGDGWEDIALANSDWNTEPADQRVLWYRNPGLSARRTDGWERKVLYQAPVFYTKEQVAAADVDADGDVDLLAHQANALYLFRSRPSDSGPVFQHVVIPKPAEARWRSRMLRLADLDGDGDLDVLGALIHHAGLLPRDRAAVFWMDVDWHATETLPVTRVIAWGSGFRGRGPLNGEKWDQAVVTDVDGDGDPDLVANCEEFQSPGRVHLAVVWFENPGLQGTGPPASAGISSPGGL